nr:MAG TPA: hypothetical protein [Caudoviricetes sp.]
MLAIVIIVRKIGALSSPCGYRFNSSIIAIVSWISAVIIGSHFFILFLNFFNGFTSFPMSIL